MIVLCAKYLFLLPPLLVLWVFWRKERDARLLLLYRGLIVLVVGFGLAKAGGALYNEPRPFVLHHFQPLIAHVADNGFPSDHTLVTAGCGFLLLAFSPPAAAIALVAAVFVGASRAACGLHSPLDIVASFLFALAANGIATALLRKPQRDPDVREEDHSAVAR
ncbi:MAG: phosphatase PAP2 family protein [Armatimonadota bacterium]|nr:phosphatase PAP2 family protein [Armatimonadota bacterium]